VWRDTHRDEHEVLQLVGIETGSGAARDSEWRTRRALADYQVMATQLKRYGMAHDLVDAAPDHGGVPGGILNALSASPQAATPSGRRAFMLVVA
jgi:hypothetical protein